MEIAIIADDTKKELMTEFCIAYCGILSKHSLCATAVTGKYISDATGLQIERMLAGSHGGAEQIASRVAYNEIDMLLFFRDTATKVVPRRSITTFFGCAICTTCPLLPISLLRRYWSALWSGAIWTGVSTSTPNISVVKHNPTAPSRELFCY